MFLSLPLPSSLNKSNKKPTETDKWEREAGGLKQLMLTPESLKVKARKLQEVWGLEATQPTHPTHTGLLQPARQARHLHTPHPRSMFPGTQTHLLPRGCSSSYSEIIIKEEITNLAVLFSLLILKLSFL